MSDRDKMNMVLRGVLKQHLFDNNDADLRSTLQRECMAALRDALPGRRITEEFEVIVDASDDDINNNTINMRIIQKSAVVRLSDLVDEADDQEGSSR